MKDRARRWTIVLLAAGMSMLTAVDAHAASWDVERDRGDSYSATRDLTSVAVRDTDESAVLRFRVRSLKDSGGFRASVIEWDENAYDIVLAKRGGHSPTVRVWRKNLESGSS